MVEEFELDAHTDAAPLKKAIKATKFEGGWTMTATAMKNALTHYSAKMRNDKQTTKACIVFTDGEASDKPALPAALKAWESKGIKVFAVGIGLKIDAAGLKAITGSANRFIQVPSIEAFSEMAAWSLLVKVCEEAIVESCELEKSIDYPGNDIRWISVENIDACQRACLDEEKCVGFALDTIEKNGKHTCWLKHKLASRRGWGERITGHCKKAADITKSAKITVSSYWPDSLDGWTRHTSEKNLVDGVGGSNVWSSENCFASNKAPKISQWILFDFAEPRFINEVVINNRIDGHKDWLFPFELHVTNELGQVHKCQGLTPGKSFEVGDPEIPSVNTNPIRINCGNLRGNSVKLVGKVGEFLTICEVNIFGY